MTKKDEGACIVSYQGINCVPSNINRIVLEISPNGVSTPITKLACHAYGLLMRATSRTLECLDDWL